MGRYDDVCICEQCLPMPGGDAPYACDECSGCSTCCECAKCSQIAPTALTQEIPLDEAG